MHEAQAITWCVLFVCVQRLASDLEALNNPSISEGRREQLEEDVNDWKEAIQENKNQMESYDSRIRGESCPKGNRS